MRLRAQCNNAERGTHTAFTTSQQWCNGVRGTHVRCVRGTEEDNATMRNVAPIDAHVCVAPMCVTCMRRWWNGSVLGRLDMNLGKQHAGGGGGWPTKADGLVAVPFALATWIGPGNGIWSTIVDLFQRIAAMWSYQITSIDGRPVTVGKVFIAVMIIVVGVPIARVVTRHAARRIMARVGITHATTEAAATVGFYITLAGILVFALWMAEIPLTVFALAGGALAIGIGFGSQNILNNFISGLILLAERPIKIGDLVEVNETFATGSTIVSGKRGLRLPFRNAMFTSTL